MTRFLSETGFGIGYGLMLLGVFLLLDGFAVDAWLHANDEELAAEEGVFTLSNPGHALVAIGLCVTILGACVGPYTRWVLPQRSAFIAMFVPAAAVALALGGSFGFASAIDSWAHDEGGHAHEMVATTGSADGGSHASSTHPGSTDADLKFGTGHDGHMPFILPEHRTTVALAESTMHEPENTQDVTKENMLFAEQFLADVREQTEKYQDVNVALSDGYARITPDIPLIGAHFFHEGYEGMDPAHPSLLLYQDTGDRWELAGISFTLDKTLGDDVPPETELGGLAGWHYHANLCFLAGGNVTIAANQAQCNGVYTPETGWLLHVWAWLDSPEGVFNHANSLLQ